MGLLNFLRRQFANSEPTAAPEPLPPPPVIRQPGLPARRRGILLAPSPQTSAAPVVPPPARQDILRFAERRDTRVAVIGEPDAKREILRLHEEINQLHRQRRRLRDERDRWERLARDLEDQLAALRAGEPGAAGMIAAADRFRRAKTVLARLTHPDSSGATGVEASIRAKLFQEFWAEFERIEAD